MGSAVSNRDYRKYIKTPSLKKSQNNEVDGATKGGDPRTPGAIRRTGIYSVIICPIKERRWPLHNRSDTRWRGGLRFLLGCLFIVAADPRDPSEVLTTQGLHPHPGPEVAGGSKDPVKYLIAGEGEDEDDAEPKKNYGKILKTEASKDGSEDFDRTTEVFPRKKKKEEKRQRGGDQQEQ